MNPFRAVDAIRLKRDGGALSTGQIAKLIGDYTAGRVPDYQMSAWLMAVFLRGMTGREVADLTRAMMESGEVYDLSSIPGPKIDKHSTGGVGDKVSLILAPLAAACGLVVPMIAGRGLGHTGGTIDKLESIPGLTTRLSRSRFSKQLSKIGVAIGAQTDRFAPADRKLYALRDVTSTVESIPLIAASIMSKKLAEGCEGLVLDVKTGSGAFMPKLRDAETLARSMIEIARAMGRKASAMITDMSAPLGRAVGNANEVIEAMDGLRGKGPEDLMTVTRALVARMIVLGGLEKKESKARKRADRALESGAALEKFVELIEAQGGDPRVVDDPERLPRAPGLEKIKADREGYLTRFDSRLIGVAASILGAGRARLDDKIDPAVGLWIRAKPGDRVSRGDVIFEAAYREKGRMAEAGKLLEESFAIGDQPIEPPRLIRRAEVKG